MVKYCQECGNASYDSAPKCGNCGAKLPPKSEANSRPPKLDGKYKKAAVITSTNDSIFSGKSSSSDSGLLGKIGSFDLSKYSNTAKDKKEKESVQQAKTAKPSFSKTATEGFKHKDAGIKDPAFFTLLPFIEEGIGADRISDMTIDVLLEDFLAYTQRMVKEMGINGRNIKHKNVAYQVPFIKRRPYLLIPQSLLAHLPIARSFDDIDSVCDYNRELRRRVCKAIGINMADFEKMRKSERKKAILAHSALLNDLLNYCKSLNVIGYDFVSDNMSLYADIRMTELVKKSPVNLAQYVTSANIDVIGITREIIGQYKTMIEDNCMYWLLYNDNHEFRDEKAAQLLFYMMAHFYCAANNIDLSRECDPGVGELDFKLSSGFNKKVLIEMKKASSSSLLAGFLKQLPAYEKAERTVDSFYLVIKDKESASNNIKKLLDKKIELYHQKKKCPEIIIVDAIMKPSASKLR